MTPPPKKTITDELRERIRILKEDEEIVLQQLRVLDDRRRETEKTRARIQGSIYAFEKMLDDEERR